MILDAAEVKFKTHSIRLSGGLALLIPRIKNARQPALVLGAAHKYCSVSHM